MALNGTAPAAPGIRATGGPMRILGLETGAEPSAAPYSSGASGSPTAAPPIGRAVATIADVARLGSATFTIPFNAPAPLPAGDPGIIVKLTDGSYVAFDARCDMYARWLSR